MRGPWLWIKAVGSMIDLTDRAHAAVVHDVASCLCPVVFLSGWFLMACVSSFGSAELGQPAKTGNSGQPDPPDL